MNNFSDFMWAVILILVSIALYILIFSQMKACADEIIICPNCGKQLYRYKSNIVEGEMITADKAEPLGSLPQPKDTDEFVCPYCGAPLNGFEFWFWKRKRPLPKMIYSGGLTVLTINGWKPYEVNIDDINKK